MAHRTMKQNQKLGNKLTHMGNPIYDKRDKTIQCMISLICEIYIKKKKSKPIEQKVDC